MRLERVDCARTRGEAAEIGFDDAFPYAELARPDSERALPIRRLLAQEARGVFPVWLRKTDKDPYAMPSSGHPSARQAAGLSRRPQARLRP